MKENTLNIIILAAGKGTRMHSKKPKVLHQIGGYPILNHVINTAKSLNPNKIIVIYGYEGEQVKQEFIDEKIIWVEQAEQLGTGHAVKQAIPLLDNAGKTLILLGDVPLIKEETCNLLLDNFESDLRILACKKNEPEGYGRIVRDTTDKVVAIVEHKDATKEQKCIDEVNTGMMAADTAQLKDWVNKIENNNVQKEYYLTDIVGFAVEDNKLVDTSVVNDEWEVTGVNSKTDLANVERAFQQNKAQALLKQGVTLLDPNRIDIRGELVVEKDVVIDVGCVFEGQVTLGEGVKIGAYCIIKDAYISAGTAIAPYSHIDTTEIGNDCRVGPYARLRPGTKIQNNAHIGNFVELKNAKIDDGSKVNHLSYVGDAEVGKAVNIGAGAITCNYDGANKYKTIIEDGVFVGSDSQLIAPVTIKKGATIAAGSTITKDAPAEQLTISRNKAQVSIANWKRPIKQKKES